MMLRGPVQASSPFLCDLAPEPRIMVPNVSPHDEMPDTPLSDLISAYLRAGHEAFRPRLVEAFEGAMIGVRKHPIVDEAPGSVDLEVVELPKGQRCLLAYADPEAVAADALSPTRFNTQTPGSGLLRLLERSEATLDGILLKSVHDRESVVLWPDDLAYRRKESAGPLPPGMMKIHDGYKVVTLHATESPGFGRTESGIWILNLGSGPGVGDALGELEEFLTTARSARVVWLVLPSVHEKVEKHEELRKRIEDVLRAGVGRVSSTAVLVPGYGDSRALIDTLLQATNVWVYRRADDGPCVVEVFGSEGGPEVGINGERMLA